MAAARWQTRKTWRFTLVTSGYHLSFMKHCIFVAPPPIGYISRRRSPRSQCWICCAMSTSPSMLIALELVGSTPHPPTPVTTETPSLSNQLVILRKKRPRFLWAYNLFVSIEKWHQREHHFFQFPWAWLTPAKGAETARASVNQTLKLSICCTTRLNVTSYCERSWKVWLL